jgi:hypothetical protein
MTTKAGLPPDPWGKVGPCVACGKITVNGGCAVETGVYRCWVCLREKREPSTDLDARVVLFWQLMHKLADRFDEAERKRDEANGAPAGLSKNQRRVWRALRSERA